jgi:hypothetical protein
MVVSSMKAQLKAWLAETPPAPAENLRNAVRTSNSVQPLLKAIRDYVPDLSTIPQLTYTLYRQFEHTGERDGYQPPYFFKRSQLTRAVLEIVLGDESPAMLDAVQDRLWSICEETSWVLPAHEEQGPDYWDIQPPVVRTDPLGAHTSLTREPDAIDLFAAETGAALAEALYLLGDKLTPEVRQRVRHEVQRHIFKPYLAYARKHWWFKGALNWNGVCNGSIALAFLYLENDLETLAEALTLVLEGFEAYIATGFEADGGSIEGVGYWNYGLMYYVIVAEMLRERTAGRLALLSQPRLKDIAYYPVGMALSDGMFMNFGDAVEEMLIAPGIVSRLAERTGVNDLRTLLYSADKINEVNVTTAKLPVIMRHAAWWDGQSGGELPHRDYFLPECRVVKFTGQTQKGQKVILGATCGHNDGHHSHTDIASFILHIDGESLIPDAGRGLYNKSYFRQQRYENIFNNSFTHNVPRIGGQLQAAGPEFGGKQQFHGTIVENSQKGNIKTLVMDFHTAYDIPSLKLARRTLAFDMSSGAVQLTDEFAFEGEALLIEEAFVTTYPVELDGGWARIIGQRTTLNLTVREPEATFTLENLDAQKNANRRMGTLNRLAVNLPSGTTRFTMHIAPAD